MGALTLEKPKCMCPIGEGYTILSRQLEQLKKLGISDIVITTGPFYDILEKYVSSLNLNITVTYIHNPNYKTTNYIFSMSLAKDFLREDLLLLHGDLVLEESVLKDLINSQSSTVAVDNKLALPEKDFKAMLLHGKVKAIGVEFFGENCVACQPAYKWLYKDFAIWMDKIIDMCNNGEVSVYAENAFNRISRNINLHPLELNLRLCNEVDNPKDLEYIINRLVGISLKGGA